MCAITVPRAPRERRRVFPRDGLVLILPTPGRSIPPAVRRVAGTSVMSVCPGWTARPGCTGTCSAA